MPILRIITSDGGSRLVDAKDGMTVMQVIRDNGCDDLLALCGGGCSCGTCHVYVAGVAAQSMAISSDENDLLDASQHRRNNSRLSCQMCVSAALAGAAITIAPQD